MSISRRGLGHVLRYVAFTTTCLIGTAPSWGQTTHVVNPLREPARVAEPAQFVEPTGPVLEAAQINESAEEPGKPATSKKAASSQRRTVRSASYDIAAPTQGQPVRSQTQEPTYGTSVLTGPPLQSSSAPEASHSGETGSLSETVPLTESGLSPGVKRMPVRAPVEGDIIYEGVFDPTISDPGLIGGGEFIGPELGACCDGSGCAQCCPAPCATICFTNLEAFGGVQGFTGPMNRGGTGSFGFNEGFNWGFPLPFFHGAFGGQIGLRATQSNLSAAEFTDANRDQLFLTGGVFRRVDWGMQGGLVIDYMSQDWYATTDLLQVRGEASWVFPCSHELGVWFTSGTQVKDATSTLPQLQTLESWEPTDLFAFFYRRRFDEGNGSEARVFAGFSGQGDGLLGADVWIPVGANFGFEANAAYLMPDESAGTAGGGHEQESWNLGLGVVWYPGCRNSCGPDYFRPLFRVADNGSFMVDSHRSADLTVLQ